MKPFNFCFVYIHCMRSRITVSSIRAKQRVINQTSTRIHDTRIYLLDYTQRRNTCSICHATCPSSCVVSFFMVTQHILRQRGCCLQGPSAPTFTTRRMRRQGYFHPLPPYGGCPDSHALLHSMNFSFPAT